MTPAISMTRTFIAWATPYDSSLMRSGINGQVDVTTSGIDKQSPIAYV